MRTSSWVQVLGKLIFHRVNKKEVLTKEMMRTGTFRSYLDRQLDWIRKMIKLDLFLNGLADPLGIELFEL